MKMKWVLRLVAIAAVCASACAGDAVDRDNVVILLDGSGSMSERMGRQVKMDAAKQAIMDVLEAVPDTTQVGLLVFSEGTRHDGWVHPLGPRDDAALLQALQPLEPGGGTPLGGYIKLAADRLLQQREEQLGYGSYRLLVVTDGEAGDRDKVSRYAPEVVARGVVLDVIGVDMAQDHQLAGLAHSYRRADDAEALKTAIRDVLGEVGGSSDDTAGADAFELLSGLPDGIAEVALTTLARGKNTPLGEDREYVPPQVTHQGGSSGHAAPAASGTSPRRGFRLPSMIWIIVIVAIGSRVIKAITRD